MKLALICRPLRFYGGVETATAGLLGELLRRGHQIDLLTTPEQGPCPGVTVRRLAVLRQPSVLRILSFALAARRAVADSAYDIVQSHERGLHQDVYRAGEGVHDAYLGAMGRRWAKITPHHRLVCALEKRIFRLRSARHIVAISRGGKAEIERLYGTPAERVSLIYNGIDLERFHPGNRARFGQATRDALNLGADSWVILFVGSGFERKGLRPLLEGFARVADARCQLVVAGRGNTRPYEEVARRLGIDAQVTWVGPYRDVERLYSAADVVALPAWYEPFGNVHLEALAAGVPVLTSARAGGSEVIRHGESGWVVSAPSPEAIAEGFRALRETDPGALAEAARASAEPYTCGTQADRFEALYGELKR
ncbi:MAG TPA: glycosyltransferase family 4 protein [Candidatus Methylomirabilis sp.]|nr:glycosyltransferase family 4 protein [Candidatus Methylomirabilis sp.]